MTGTIEPPKSGGCCSIILPVLLFVLFAVILYLWSLVCPIYEYKQAGDFRIDYDNGSRENVESISFEHWFFDKSSVVGRVGFSADTGDQLFKGRWEGNRLFLTFQDGGHPEEAIVTDTTVLFRGKTFISATGDIGGRSNSNLPGMWGN